MDTAQTVSASDDIVRRIVALAPCGVVSEPAVLDQLISATQELIAVFKTEGGWTKILPPWR